MDGLFAGVRELPNIHPVVVHLPLVLLPLGFAFDVCGLVTARREWQAVGRWTLWGGTLAAGIAVYTGHAAGEAMQPYVSDEAAAVMQTHHNLGIVTLVTAVVLSLWRLLLADAFPSRVRLVYLALAVAMMASLAVGADHGGRLVYHHGVAVQTAADSLHGAPPRAQSSSHH